MVQNAWVGEVGAGGTCKPLGRSTLLNFSGETDSGSGVNTWKNQV